MATHHMSDLDIPLDIEPRNDPGVDDESRSL